MLLPTNIPLASQEVGMHPLQAFLVLERFKRIPAITQECDMQGVCLKTLYKNQLIAHLGAVFRLS